MTESAQGRSVDFQDPANDGLAALEAEVTTDIATARLVRFNMCHAPNHDFQPKQRYWIDLCLSARPIKARASYPDIWGAHRYEPMGDLFIVPPGRRMHIRGDAGVEQVSIVCEIEADSVDRWLSVGVDWTDRKLAAALDVTSQPMRFCLARLASEARHGGIGSEAISKALVDQLAVEVARYCEDVSEEPLTGGLASWRLRLIDERIQSFASPPSLEELAILCSMSKRQLTRAFRSSRGVSVGDYVASVRLDAARRLLATDRNIKAIAFDLGFASPSAFSNAFRRLTGLTPRQFRARQLRGMAMTDKGSKGE